MSWVDWEGDGVAGEEAHYYGDEGAVEEVVFQLVGGESVVLGDEVEVGGQVGGVWAGGFHVSFRGVVLDFAFEGEGEFEAAAGDFDFAQISDLVFEGLEVLD